jgi:arginine decarboxylase-like protein
MAKLVFDDNTDIDVAIDIDTNEVDNPRMLAQYAVGAYAERLNARIDRVWRDEAHLFVSNGAWYERDVEGYVERGAM